MKHKIAARALILMTLIAGGLFAVNSVWAAATITVTTTADLLADDGQCSLREAIIAANTDSAVSGCPAGSGADTIQFDLSLPQPATFILTLTGVGEDNAATGDLDVIGTLIIEGLGQNQIILDGNGTDRVFDIHPAANFTISGVTIQNGNPGVGENGGGVNVNSTARITITESLINGNTALNGGGIYSIGGVTMSNSTVSSNNGDGVVNNEGLVMLTQVSVTDNLGGYGVLNEGQGYLIFTGGEVSGNQNGGVYNSTATATLTNVSVLNNTNAGGVVNIGLTTSRLTMIDCVVMDNSSTGSGGGIKNDGVLNIVDIQGTTVSSNQAASAGGGIFNLGTMSVSSSTIDNNQARSGGGIDNFGGSLTLTNDTISANMVTDNGGGLYNRSDATLLNVTITGNSASGVGTGGNIYNDTALLSIKNTIVANSDNNGNCFNDGGSITSVGHNLDSGDTCGFIGPNDLVNSNALLGPLQDNGGATLTHALLGGSLAIDHGDNTDCPISDQRGFSRPADGDGDNTAVCDIGAYELVSTAANDTIGLYNSSYAAYYLKTVNEGGVPDIVFQYGAPDPTWVPLMGDWDGDGSDSVGVYVPNLSIFFLKDTNAEGASDYSIQYGPPGAGWLPLVGDWDGDGDDTVGMYDPSSSAFYLSNELAGGTIPPIFFGAPGWTPLVGDWDGDGTDTVGVYSPTIAAYYLRNSNTNGGPDIVFQYGAVDPTWVPLMGDWDGDGDDTVGVYLPASSLFFLKNSNAGGPSDLGFQYGPPGAGWEPVTGNFE